MYSAAQAQALKVILSPDKVNNASFVECEAYCYRQMRPIRRFRKQRILYMQLRQKFRPSVVCKILIQGTYLFFIVALPLCVQEWNHELPVSWYPGTSSTRDSDASGASAATNSIPADGALLAFSVWYFHFMQSDDQVSELWPVQQFWSLLALCSRLSSLSKWNLLGALKAVPGCKILLWLTGHPTVLYLWLWCSCWRRLISWKIL